MPVDELRLPALAPRRNDAVPGHRVGHLRAVVGANDVQAQVDSRGQPRRGEHVAVVDEQHLLVDPHRGVQPPQRVGELPVGGRGPPVEQACRGEDERAGADRHQPGAGPDRVERGADVRREHPVPSGGRVARAGDDDGVGGGEHLGPGGGNQSKAVGRRDGVARQPAGDDVVERVALVVLGGAEQHRRDRGVESDDGRQQQYGDTMHARHQFGMFLMNGVIHATSRRPPRTGSWSGDSRWQHRDRFARSALGPRAPPRIHWAWVVAAVSFIAILGAAGFRSVPGVMMNPAAPRVRLVARHRRARDVGQHDAVRPHRAVRRRSDGPLRRATGAGGGAAADRGGFGARRRR